jgi:phosphatidylinositol glycan class C protein
MLVPSGATLVFAVVLLIVNLGGPLMLWWGWSWKSRRDGNWDVAVVRLRKRNRQ